LNNPELGASTCQLRELESKAKEQDTNMTTVESRVVVATPVNAKVMSEKENHVLRISNSLNKKLDHAENTPEAPEAACNERKRKGEARNASIGGGEQENNNNGGRKRSLPAEREARLKRKSTEPPPQVKNLVRSTASSRAAAKAAAAAAPSSRAGGAKQQPGGGNKTRGWVR
jgi:kinesin family member C2/C3